MSMDAARAIVAPPVSAGQAAVPKDSKFSDWDFSFHNLLSIINPLEHLPVIGTLYRAITGTHIGVPERIAGDALYGGLWGAVSGIADAAFEAVTARISAARSWRCSPAIIMTGPWPAMPRRPRRRRTFNPPA